MTSPSETHSPEVGRGTRTGLKIALIGAGIAVGAIGATAIGANAATTTSGSATSSSSTSSSTAGTLPPPPGGGYHVPGMSGTVTAVGSSSVTIKTSSGTTTYAVTSASDIDKNGEAQLSNLVVGDAVTFNVMPNSATTINKLHAGDEAKDRPAGPPAGAPAGPPPGTSGTTG